MQYILKLLLRRPLLPLLVMLQVVLACAIVSNAMFLLQQKVAPILVPDGIGDPSHLILLYNIAARGEPWSTGRLQAVEAELRTSPMVDAVSYAAALPMLDTLQLKANVMGVGERTRAHPAVYVGDHLVDTLKLHLIAGRDFMVDENAALKGMGFEQGGPVIITRSLADYLFPHGSALGRTIEYTDSSGGQRVVVGVVEHLVRNEFGPDTSVLGDAMLFPGVSARSPLPMFAVRINAEAQNVTKICDSLSTIVDRQLGAQMVTGIQPRCETFAAARDRMLARPRAAVWLLCGVTAVVLIVALIGIMGMTGYWVQQRTKQIGICRALGARRCDVLRGIHVESGLIVGLGVFLGMIAAYGVNLWLMRHFELSRLPWAYLPAGAISLLVLGQLAVLMPALRAAAVEPATATRTI